MRNVIAGIIVLMIALVGCEASKDVSVRVDSDRTIDIREGQTLAIELEANPTTGYLWEVSVSAGKGVLRQTGHARYIRRSERIGAPGVRIYRFEGLKEGQTELVFKYRRPWEKAEGPAKKYIVRVTVR